MRYYNAAGRARKLTLPAGITLAAARKLAADALLEVAQGRDPGSSKRDAKRNASARAADTVERLADQFIEQHAKRKTRENTWRATASIFRRLVVPVWGRRSVHEIVRRDVIDLVEGIAVDRPIAGNRTHAAVSRFFRWLCERDVIAASPCTGVPHPSKEKPRDRVLDDGELLRLWRAAETIGGPAGACIKLLMLTGQRRSEIGRLQWNEVGDDALNLAAARMKGRIGHSVPLSTQAAAIIASMPRAGDHVFGRPVRFDLLKSALDIQMGSIPKWVVHDIRRSVASGMARIGVPVPVIEKILAHRSGTFGGITAVYQRHSFMPEMAAALQKWADHVDRLVSGKSAKVVKLQRR